MIQKTIYLYLFTIVFLTGCAKNRIASVNGKIELKNTPLKIAGKSIIIQKDGSFSYQTELDHPTISNIRIGQEEWEVFIYPGKNLAIRIDSDSVNFSGDLKAENDYLLEEKNINKQVLKYLNKNWYSLHKKDEHHFLIKVDSIRNIFHRALEIKASLNRSISKKFIKINTASINYAFDRIILRYPQQHFRFTKNRTSLSSKTLSGIRSKTIAPEYAKLSTYKKYVKTWLDLEIEKQLSGQDNKAVYSGYSKTATAIELISKNFKNAYIRDLLSFEYVKSHIKQYTWINGKNFLDQVKSGTTTTSILKSIADYESKALAKRKDNEIYIYKTVKKYHLEAYFFKPENFDSQKRYPALAAFHGGGWISGNATWTFESAKHAAKNGLIGIAVEYRLSNRLDISPLEAMEDTRDFIVWLRNNADSLKIDPDKIVAKGISAGGHLVSSTSVIQKSDKLNSVANAMILVSPALDTQDSYFKSLIRNTSKAENFSPIKKLKKGLKMPKTLILQGETDRLTPTSFAKQFKYKMDTLLYHCKLVIYKNCGHLFTPSHLDDTGWPQPDPEISKKAFQEETGFLKKLGYIK